jgi:RNA polymerase sigma factor (sigma-70 family)
MNKINVTIKAAIKHGDLHKAIKKLGSSKALAEHLGVDSGSISEWYGYKSCPPIVPSRHWPQSRIDELERKLFALTGKLLDDLFPATIRDRAFLDMDKNVEATKEIDSHHLLGTVRSVQRIAQQEPDVVEVAELQEAVHSALNSLSWREKEVVKMRNGIGVDKPMTLDEVGDVLRITKERVRQIEGKALRKLAAPDVAGNLVGHLDHE